MSAGSADMERRASSAVRTGVVEKFQEEMARERRSRILGSSSRMRTRRGRLGDGGCIRNDWIWAGQMVVPGEREDRNVLQWQTGVFAPPGARARHASPLQEGLRRGGGGWRWGACWCVRGGG